MSTRVVMKQSKAKVRQRSMWMGMDYYLLFSFVGLLLFGVVMVSSASIGIAEEKLGDAFYYGRRQLIFVAIGLALAFAALRTPTWVIDRLGFVLLAVAYALLVLVLIPGVGKTVNGAQRWIDFGFITLQVSEFARLFMMIYLAGYMVRRGEEVRTDLKGFIKPIVLIGIAALLLLMEPDFGAAAVLTATCLGMLFMAGARVWQFAACLLIVLVMAALLVIFEPYRVARLMAFLDPWGNAYGSGYQLTQSLIAFGSGGIDGLGLGASVQKLFYLPEAHNDFVFAIVGEELGLLGVIAVLAAFALLVQRVMHVAAIALNRGEEFSAYLCYAIALWIAAQVFINTGVSMGMLPTKGLTLPLMSAGGSAIMVTCLAMGLVLRVNFENAVAVLQARPQNKSSQQKSNQTKSSQKKKPVAKTTAAPLADMVNMDGPVLASNGEELMMPAPSEDLFMDSDDFLNELDKELGQEQVEGAKGVR